MQLQDKINDPNLNLNNLAEMFDHISEVTVNLAGVRVISIQSYDGYASLDVIANKLLQMSTKSNLSDDEKADGAYCESALKTCYNTADDVWFHANPITYISGLAVRIFNEGYGNSFSSNPFSTKFQIFDGQVQENMKIKRKTST